MIQLNKKLIQTISQQVQETLQHQTIHIVPFDLTKPVDPKVECVEMTSGAIKPFTVCVHDKSIGDGISGWLRTGAMWEIETANAIIKYLKKYEGNVCLMTSQLQHLCSL